MSSRFNTLKYAASPASTPKTHFSSPVGYIILSNQADFFNGMRRFRLRRLWRVNSEALRNAAGLNLKRSLKKRGWGRRLFPAEALSAFFLAVGSFLVSICVCFFTYSVILHHEQGRFYPFLLMSFT